MKKRKFCFLVNPTANNNQTGFLIEKVEKKLSTLPIIFRTVVARNSQEAQLVTQQAITQGEYIAVMGGDGSIRAIASVVKTFKGVLAIIPSGRGNDLARMLNIPLDPLMACDKLAFGKEIKIDVGEVNKEIFLGICSVGFDSVANERANRTRLFKSKLVYIYAGLITLFNWKPINFYVTIDGNKFEHVGYSVAVANSRCYGGGMYLAPQASIQDGLFDVVLIGNISKWRFLINFPRVFTGLHINQPGITIIRGKKIQIETNEKFKLCADGDLIASPPATIEIIPQALTIIV